MSHAEPFTLIERQARGGDHELFEDVLKFNSAKRADVELQYIHALRQAHQDMIVTAIPASNISLRSFAAAGFATCELDLDTDQYISRRGYNGPGGGKPTGTLAEAVQFAKYRYHWAGEDFILYTVDATQLVLKERRKDENALGPSKTTDALIQAIGDWMVDGVVWVFDNYWYQDKNLYREVKKMSWDKVILDEDMKKDLTTAAGKFFSSKDVYDDLGVPWKRGLLWHGPPGNGKTVSIKALMRTLLDREPAIPTLYVKAAPMAYHINQVFSQARNLAPCMLVLEDIETIVTPATRSYFFNQMDGLENNSGLFVVATTNFLDKLDPGLSKRPSRFDRKYLFPIPNEHERILYCQYWRHKVEGRPSVKFPEKLCAPMAKITGGFSFAFLQECFVATLLVLANQATSKEDLNEYTLWVEFKKQAAALRKQIEDGSSETGGEAFDIALADIPPPPPLLDAPPPPPPPPGSCESDGGSQELPVLCTEEDANLPILHNGKYFTVNPACYELR